MRTRNALLATVALMASAILAAPASAAISYTVLTDDMPLPTGQVMAIDFDSADAGDFSSTSITNGDFTFTGGYVRAVADGLDSGVSAPPPGDATANYETVIGGQTATLTSLRALRSFSFYLGSPDTFNTVRFSNADGVVATLNGAQIWGATSGDDGAQTWGRRVSYDFGLDRVTKIEFISTGNSFEFDNIAAGAVPEPATWAMMLMGFGGMGLAIRRRRSPVASLA